jgi:DNA polymerase-1
MLAREGYQIPSHFPYTKDSPVIDTMLGAHLVNENEFSYRIKGSGYALKYLADKYGIGQGSRDEEELREVIMKEFGGEVSLARKSGAELKGSTDGVWKGFMWKLPPEQVAPYAEADVLLTWGLMQEHVWPHLLGWGLVSLFHQVCNYNLLITKTEQLGVKVDEEALHRVTVEAEERAEAAENALWFATGLDNCNSYARVNNYFGIDSSKEMPLLYAVMEGRVDAEKAKLLLDARGKLKVLSSYLRPYNRYLANDGAIHPGFKVHGTATGRLSCSDPNIMALPRDVTNQPAKAVFVARPDHVLVEIDLSQAELRVASHFAAQLARDSGEPEKYLDTVADPTGYLTKMGAVLAEDDSDLHTVTMKKMQEYNPDVDRDLAKRINLSAIFGIGAHKFSKTYAVPLARSKTALLDWRKIYPEFILLYQVADEIATRQGYITLPISGRVRRYTNDGDNYTSKASSNWVQGTVADVMRIAMHNVDAWLDTVDGGNLLLQVHDSLLLELRDNDRLYQTIAEIQTIMTEFEFIPRLRTEAKIGLNWGELKPRPSRHDNLGEGGYYTKADGSDQIIRGIR